MTTRSAIKPPSASDYSHLEPLPDPPKEPDMQQFLRIYSFASILEPHFADRSDVLIAGGGYLLQNTGDSIAGSFVPDCVFVRGVRDPGAIIDRNGYIISEVGKPPDFVLEVASRSTARRDYTVKREGYAALGVTEYWRFDHTGGRYHDAPLAGDALVDDRYAPLPTRHEPDGLIWGHSEILELDLCWDAGNLRFRDPATGEFLLTPEELQAERDAATAERDVATAERDRAQARAQAAEAELDALREELRRLQQG